MKLQELLMPLSLALLATLTLQVFWSYRQGSTQEDEQAKIGQRFEVIKRVDPIMQKPLNAEVDFYDEASMRQEQSTLIETDLAHYEFSSNGAVLERLMFKPVWSDARQSLTTIAAAPEGVKERGAFLLALDDKTPYYYTLKDHKEEQNAHILTYEAQTQEVLVRKRFVVSKLTYQIDLDVIITPRGKMNTITPRLFFPAPSLVGLGKDETITGLYGDERNAVNVVSTKGDIFSSFWLQPNLFGAQDRYFVNALVKDSSGFVQRGYFTSIQKGLIAILEGPQSAQERMWQLQFYFGPKEESAMAFVDPRLEQTLQYGWFSFMTKPLSKIMLLILNFINGFVHNYGFAIILLTLLIKLLLLPFTYNAEAGMKKRTEFQKKMQRLQEKYRQDPQRLAQERAELFRKQGMPGMSGCLPVLFQVPMFFALSWMLSNAIELYQAPFLWISDLSVKDPFYILPLGCAVAMMLQMSTMGDAKQQVSSIAMALIIAAFVSNLPAGLALYIFISTLASVIQAFIGKWARA